MGVWEGIAAIITAACTGTSAVLLVMTKWQADKVADRDEEISKLTTRVTTLEEQAEYNHGRFRDFVLWARASIAHGLEQAGLLAVHAPTVPAPPAPPLPDSIKDEV